MKIGIVSLYYNSVNYGGNLQAYALCKVLNDAGYEAEQIQTRFQSEKIERKGLANNIKKLTMIHRFIFRKVKDCGRHTYNRIHRDELMKYAGDKKKVFEHFHSVLIPHSEKFYDQSTIEEVVSQYDAFIVGSDQVWNPSGWGKEWHNTINLLDFVPMGTPKFSYAASIPAFTLSEDQRSVFRESLKDYIGVTVREKTGVDLLSGVSPTDVIQVLDPTMLLTGHEWDNVCAERMIEKPYIFCYFLGENRNIRILTTQLARKKGLIVVGIPYLSGNYNPWDTKCYDKSMPNVSPEQFISLIKNAEIVLTDSFHASVFSMIYEKEVFIFPRDKHAEMGDRIATLTNMYGVEERFCDNEAKRTLAYIENCGTIEYDTSKCNEMRDWSMNYIKQMLNIAEGMKR